MDASPKAAAEDHLTTYVSQELAAIRADWSALIQATPNCPAWDWSDMVEAMLALTATPEEELIVRGAMAGLTKQARFKPPTLVLEEILRLAVAAQNLSFHKVAQEMLEAEMP